MIGLWYVANLERSPTSVEVTSCVSCGDKRPTERVAVYALPFVEAPYCGDCAERARRKEWNVPLVMMGVAFLLPSIAVVQPFGSVASALGVAFAVSLVAPALYVLTTFGSRVGGAVRAHKLMPIIQIDCARPEVAKALTKSCGGFVEPGRELRVTSALSFVPLTLFFCAFGYGLANWLFLSTIAIDDTTDAPVTVSVDGRDVSVAGHTHATVQVRAGHHAIAWTNVQRAIDIDRRHDALVNPGPTSCYRKEMIAAGFLTASDKAEMASAGLMPIEEVQILPTVKHWFSPLPAEKKSEPFEPNVEVAIQHDELCTAHVGCAPFVACYRAEKDARGRADCLSRAATLCR